MSHAARAEPFDLMNVPRRENIGVGTFDVEIATDGGRTDAPLNVDKSSIEVR